MKTLPVEIQDYICSFVSSCKICNRVSIKNHYSYCDHTCYFIHKKLSIYIVNTSLFLLVLSVLHSNIPTTILLLFNFIIAMESLF